MIDAPHVKLRSSRQVRLPLLGAAAGLAAAIFAVDLTTTAGFGISALYVIPLLLSTLSGPPGLAFLSGGVASMLVVGGLIEAPWAATPWLCRISGSRRH